jgi:hypothetical protein
MLALRNLGILSLGLLSAFPALSQVSGKQHVLVSDIDDTVKITDVNDASDSISNSFFGRDGFPGMAPLFDALRASDGDSAPSVNPPDLSFVTGSPSFLRSAIEEFLHLNGFFDWALITRNFFGRPEMVEYKTGAIRGLLGKLSEAEQEAYLFGDDTQADPQVYQIIQDGCPDLIAGVYIRQIRNDRDDLPGQKGFFTAVDIGIDLLLQARLRTEDIKAILADFRDPECGTFEGDRAFPPFAQCPWDPNWLTHSRGSELERLGQSQLLDELRKFEWEVEVTCKTRENAVP